MVRCIWSKFIDVNTYRSIDVTDDLLRLITTAVALRLPEIEVIKPVGLVNVSQKLVQAEWKRIRNGNEAFLLKLEVLTPNKVKLYFKYGELEHATQMAR